MSESLRIQSVLVIIFFLMPLLTGCISAPPRELSRKPVRYAALPNGNDPLNPTQLQIKFAGRDSSASIREGGIPYFERVRGHALNILLLSGGGQNGAFGAGFLKGWRNAGNRPEFDIVTGVSTGALLSTHAFLGTPSDDVVLEEIFTHVERSDIYRERWITNVLFGAESFYDTSPLQRLLDKYITEDVLKRVAEAYDDNRRLMVGTTNLDYGQTWVWNLSLIAKENRPGALELYKKVLLASASPPLAFPQVEINGYLFGDGGVRQNIVAVGLAGNTKPSPPLHGPGNIYVIQNGKRSDPPYAVSNDLGSLAGSVVGQMLTTSMDSLLMRSYFGAQVHGYRFNLVAIPDNVEIGNNPLAFDPQMMRNAFEAGYALAQQQPIPWDETPNLIKDIPEWGYELLQPKNRK